MAPLTSDEFKRVETSWKVVMKNTEDNGVFIFKTFLEKHNYFSKFQKFSGIPKNQLQTNRVFRNHSLAIIQRIDSIVSKLKNESLLKDDLNSLGKMHAKKKITEKEFQELKAVILSILEENFQLPKETLKAWEKTFDYSFVYIFETLHETS